MKIAMYCTMWNEEVVRYYYNGVNRWAQETGNIVDVFTCYGRIGMENPFNAGAYSMYDYPDLYGYDGAILMLTNINEPSVREKIISNVKKHRLPCVVLDSQVEGFSSISIDQEYYMHELTWHLLEEHNVKKIAYIGAFSDNVESSARYKGFSTAVREAGVTVPEEWIFERHFAWNDGIDVAKILLKDRENFPEAIVCSNDNMAIGVCEALQSAGMEVGKDCLVTGFDRYYLGENYAPSLTTISRPREEFIYEACKMLENYSGVKHRKAKGSIFLGQSCGCGSKDCPNNSIVSGIEYKCLAKEDEREFRRDVFLRFNRDSDFDEVVSSVEEGTLFSDDVADIVDAMRPKFDSLKEGELEIHLTPDFLDYTEDSKRAEDVLRGAADIHVLFSDSESMDASVRGHAYVYAPVHFMDRVFGFYIFRDMPYLLENRNLRNLCTTMGYSFEIMIQRQRYRVANNELEKLYETDNLTGTFNRHGLTKHAERMFMEARRKGTGFLVVFVDVDGLKKVNDVHGHEAGDIVIEIVGKSTMEMAPKGARVFRYGGDEFLMLSPYPGEEAYQEFYDGLMQTIASKAEKLHLPYHCGASVGRAVAPSGEMHPLEYYIKQADHAMYEIKLKRHEEMDAARQK